VIVKSIEYSRFVDPLLRGVLLFQLKELTQKKGIVVDVTYPSVTGYEEINQIPSLIGTLTADERRSSIKINH